MSCIRKCRTAGAVKQTPRLIGGSLSSDWQMAFLFLDQSRNLFTSDGTSYIEMDREVYKVSPYSSTKGLPISQHGVETRYFVWTKYFEAKHRPNVIEDNISSGWNKSHGRYWSGCILLKYYTSKMSHQNHTWSVIQNSKGGQLRWSRRRWYWKEWSGVDRGIQILVCETQ